MPNRSNAPYYQHLRANLFGGPQTGNTTITAFNDNNQSIDFRVRGANDNNLLYLVGSSNEAGIGTSSPTAKLHVADTVRTSGSDGTLLVVGAAHTTLAALTEVNFVRFNLGQTVQWATGAISTERAVLINRPTLAFVGASTVANAVTVDIDGPPSAGTLATITNASSLRVGGASTQVSAAGLIYQAINVPAHTLTITGTTQVTSAAIAGIGIGQLTLTDTSAVTVDTAASLYINNAPLAAGSVTLTSPYALWVDAGNVRLDGSVVIGGTAVDATAALTVTSTTQGILLPRMTTTQRDAITSPTAGLLIYNSTTNKLNFRAAAAWEAVTSA